MPQKIKPPKTFKDIDWEKHYVEIYTPLEKTNLHFVVSTNDDGVQFYIPMPEGLENTIKRYGKKRINSFKYELKSFMEPI